jgi:uncharacterized repeat protein (TIGR01451 family)
VTIEFQVTIDDPTSPVDDDEVCNQATITATGITAVTDDPDTGAADDATCTTIPRPDLTTAKTNDTGGIGAVSIPFAWTIAITNSGTATATFASTEVILRDNLPIGATYGMPSATNLSNVSGTISCTIISSTLTCTANGAVTINSGGSFDVVFAVTPTATGNLINPSGGVCAVDPDDVINEGDNSNNACSNTVDIQAVDLQISKDDGGVTVEPGDTITYTLTYTNAGDLTANSTTITDTVPANTTFNSGLSTGGWVCLPDDNAGSVCTLNAGALAGGTGGTADFAVVVDSGVSPPVSQIDNTAEIGDNGSNGPDATPADNSSSDSTPLNIPGDIIILKVSEPGGASEIFTFTHTITAPNSFTLTHGAAQGFNDITPGAYTVTEADPTLTPGGFDLSGIACDDANSTGNTGARTATINLDPGETVTCIFTNTQRGSITIIKSSDPISPTNFTFSGDLGSFTLDDAVPDDGDAFTNTVTFLNASAGTYTVTEAPPTAGYNPSSIECDDGASTTPSTGSIGSRSATINLDPAEAVICTFTNSQSASGGLFYLPIILKNFGFTPSTPKPDLIVTALSLTPNGDGTHTVQVTGFNQSNIGVTPGNNFFVSIYVDPPEPFTAATLPPLSVLPALNLGLQSAWFGPQQGRTVQGALSLTDGPHRIYAWIDPFPLPPPSTSNGTVAEQIETNNFRLLEVTISSTGADVGPLAGPEPPTGIPPTPTPEP